MNKSETLQHFLENVSHPMNVEKAESYNRSKGWFGNTLVELWENMTHKDAKIMHIKEPVHNHFPSVNEYPYHESGEIPFRYFYPKASTFLLVLEMSYMLSNFTGEVHIQSETDSRYRCPLCAKEFNNPIDAFDCCQLCVSHKEEYKTLFEQSSQYRISKDTSIHTI